MNKYPCCKHCGHNHGKGHNTPCNMCIVDNYQSAEFGNPSSEYYQYYGRNQS